MASISSLLAIDFERHVRHPLVNEPFAYVTVCTKFGWGLTGDFGFLSYAIRESASKK